MLNKIENITLNPNSRNEIKSGRKEYSINQISRQQSFSDTITFSAALLFLSQLKWRLKKISNKSQDEIELEISVNDITYSTTINLKNPATQNILFVISNEFPLKHNNSSYEINLSFNYQNVQSEIENYDYDGINKLFLKIPSFEYSGEKEISHSFFYEIIEGLEYEMSKDCSFVYQNMILFLDKLTESNLFNIIAASSGNEVLVRLNRIIIAKH